MSPEAQQLRQEARDAIDADALDKLDAVLDSYVDRMSDKDKRHFRREMRKDAAAEPAGDAEAAPPDPEADPDALGGLGTEEELPASPLLRKMEGTLGDMGSLLESLGGPRAAEVAAAAAGAASTLGGSKGAPAGGMPSLDADFWRAFPAAAPSLQQRPRRRAGAADPDAPRPTPGLSKAAQRRRRASDERARLLAERRASLGLEDGARPPFSSAASSAWRGAGTPSDWPAADDDGMVTMVAEAAPDGGVRPAAAAPPAGRPPSAAAASASSRPDPASASPFSLACAALGIDPYAVTPTSLGLSAPPGDAAGAAEAAEAWEDALAAVDMEEEGGGVPAHSPRTGALLTDRQRRAYALARAALSFFPADDAAFPWAALSGRGLSVEGVLQGAGLQPEDLGGGGGDDGGDGVDEAEVRKRIRAALLAEAGRRGR